MASIKEIIKKAWQGTLDFTTLAIWSVGILYAVRWLVQLMYFIMHHFFHYIINLNIAYGCTFFPLLVFITICTWRCSKTWPSFSKWFWRILLLLLIVDILVFYLNIFSLQNVPAMYN